ncbi:MAG TPA: thiol reductant ABC exporter subunit CydD [Anaerolineae bacterium]|nr:thiol reductant ABC exporter subunit CydD [Anaerolineae bacterium]
MKPLPARRLFELSPSARTLLVLAVSAGFCAGALLVIQIVLLSSTVHRVFILGQTLADVVPLLGVMLALLLLRAGLIWAHEVSAQGAASRVKQGLRGQLLVRIYALGPGYTRSERSGELVNTAVEGIEALDPYVAQFLPARALAFLLPPLVLLAVFLLDPWTTLVLLFAGPMLLLLLALIGGRAKAITERRFLELSWMSAFFLDVLQGLATLKMFGRSREQADNIERISQHYGKTTMEVLATAFQTSLMMEWAATAATAMVALEASLRLINGSLPFDRALAVLVLTPEFFLPLRQMAVKYHIGTAGKAAAERVFAVVDGPGAEGKDRKEGRRNRGAEGWPAVLGVERMASATRYDIRFEGVWFAYPPRAQDSCQLSEKLATVLRGLTFSIPHGQTVALVGATGAGKSTVASLLLRFIEPDVGRITVNGEALTGGDPAAWRRHIAYVPQLPHLFHGTALDNIRLARPEASLEQVIAAAAAAHAHDFIQALPQGYDTPLGEGGARLSGGQRQRLALARAFLKDAPVLLLDEPTASLDAQSEALIRDALARLMANRTVLLIAHRLELAYAADHIVVMDTGQVVETGTHDALLTQNGPYAHLVASYTAAR